MSSVDINRLREETKAEYDKVNKQSVFNLPIKNTLGLDNLKQKAVLKAYALQHPVEYTKARAQAYENIVSRLVQENYDHIWNLLKQGKIDNLSNETIFQGVAGLEGWTPGLQEAEIGKLATGYAESIMNLFDDIFEKIVPSDYKQLAEDKLTQIAKLDIVNRT